MKQKTAFPGIALLLMFTLAVASSTQHKGEPVEPLPQAVVSTDATQSTAADTTTPATVNQPSGSALQVGAAEAVPASPTAYRIPWQSVNAGGAPATSTNYRLNGSAGQSAIGYAASTGYQHGIGYWYGAGKACDCGVWGDVTGDGLINPVDVVCIVNFVYKSLDQRVQPPNCPKQAGDVNCDNAVNPVDVVRYVNYVYKGQTTWPCPAPCGP